MTTIEIIQAAVRIFTYAAFAATTIVLINEMSKFFKETNYK